MVNIFRKMWSKKQIKEVVSDSPSEVLKALQNQDLKVKTIEQSEYEYVKDFTLSSADSDFTFASAFTKILVKNKSMYICIVERVSNTGATSKSCTLENIVINDLPLKYQDSIYDVNGKKLSEAPIGVAGNIIARFPIYFMASLLYMTITHSNTGEMTMAISGSSASITAGTSVIIDGRIELLI